MIRHIVLWKLDSEYSGTEKANIMTQLKTMLLDLKPKIHELKSIEVWFNSEKAGAANFDVMLDTSFGNMDDLDKYRIHPDHLKVAEYLKTLKLQRASIDFEF